MIIPRNKSEPVKDAPELNSPEPIGESHINALDGLVEDLLEIEQELDEMSEELEEIAEELEDDDDAD